MYNLKNTKINFVSAEDGKVFLSYTENGINKKKGSENPSSMDFAKEYGFRSHDWAKKLYKNALNLI